MPAAVAIPLITAAASGTAAVIGSKINSDASERAGQRTASATDRATQIAQEQEATRHSEFLQQQDEAKRQWDAEQANKQPYRQVSQDALLRVRDLLGFPQGASVSTSGSAGTSTASPAASKSGTAADLKALIDSGIEPQQAAMAFNQKFGRSTGNEAQYYAPSAQTSGKAVIGLPDAYLSQEPNGWNITVRGGGARPQTAMAAAMPASMAAKASALNAPVGAATDASYSQVVPFSQLMRGVR